jgi:uncharacterized membrane protein
MDRPESLTNRPTRPLRPDGGTAPADDAESDTPLEELVAGLVVGAILLAGFGLMFAGVPWFWVVFPVGFAGLLPAAIALAKYYERRQPPADEPADDERADALSVLRARYARGDIDEAEFERRIERLLETESVADASAYLESSREQSRERGGEPTVSESATERERR